MKTDLRQVICKKIIQYLLKATPYTFKDIADLSGNSVKEIQDIYLRGTIPKNFPSELRLLKLYATILEELHAFDPSQFI